MLHISFSSTRYHTNTLCRSGDLICEKRGRYFRLFPAGTNDTEKSTYALLRNESARAILSALVDMQRLTQKEITDVTGLAKSTVSEHLQVFLQAHIIREVYAEEKLRAELEDPQHIASLLKLQRRVTNRLVDNFVELWDF